MPPRAGRQYQCSPLVVEGDRPRGEVGPHGSFRGASMPRDRATSTAPPHDLRHIDIYHWYGRASQTPGAHAPSPSHPHPTPPADLLGGVAPTPTTGEQARCQAAGSLGLTAGQTALIQPDGSATAPREAPPRQARDRRRRPHPHPPLPRTRPALRHARPALARLRLLLRHLVRALHRRAPQPHRPRLKPT
jgi:hypothetical protein